MEGQRNGRRRNLAILGLGVAIAVSVANLLSIDSKLSFVADDWGLLVNRPGWSPGSLLDPFNEHLLLGPTFIYKVLLALFGMGSAMPYFVVSTALFATAVALVFFHLRTRVGDWLALIAVLPLLFLGGSSEDLLWAFQMGFFGSIAAGVGMLIALDRGDRRGDRAACLLLLVSFSFASLGLAFAAAAVVSVLLGEQPRRRLGYVLFPVGLYALWWLGWGHTAQSHLGLDNLLHLPEFVFDAAGAGVATLLGRDAGDPGRPGHPPLLCQGLLVVVAIAIGYRVWREKTISNGLVVVLVLAFAFWALTGLDRGFGRPPISSRYQFPSAVFLLLILGEALRGLRIPRLAVLAALLVSAAAVAGGISILDRERGTWEYLGNSWRSTLGALEVAGDRVDPHYVIPEAGPPVRFGDYQRAAAAYGTPAFGEAQLSGESIGAIADNALVVSMGISLSPRGAGEHPALGRCDRGTAARLGPRGRRLDPGQVVLLANTGAEPTQLTLSRFGPPPGVAVGGLPPGETRQLSIPSDESSRPWLLVADGSLRVCRQASLHAYSP